MDKNGPTSIKEGFGKNIFVIEFWRTDCQPCLKSMPLLHKLQSQFKNQGVIVIGISDEKAPAVKKLIDKYPNLSYKIAVDKNGKTFKKYMKGNGDIPAAFIINKNGVIAWIGNPLDMYLPLKRIVTGKFNIKESANRQTTYKEVKNLLVAKKYDECLKLLAQAMKDDPANSRYAALTTYVLFQQNKKADALNFLTAQLKKNPTDLDLFKLKCHVLVQLKKLKALDAFYYEFINNCKDSPVVLNELARKLLGTKFGEARLAPALKAAELAYSNPNVYKLQRAGIGETLARIYYMIGRIDRAIKIQQVVCKIYQKNKSNKRYVYAIAILNYYQRAYKIGK